MVSWESGVIRGVSKGQKNSEFIIQNYELIKRYHDKELFQNRLAQHDKE